MAKQTAQDKAVLALFEALGVTPEQVASAIGSSQVEARQRKAIRVDVLTGEDATKYGDVSISKAVNGGRYIAKLGVFQADLDGFIADLQAARDALA